jgi:LPS-assembly lipoprotein
MRLNSVTPGAVPWKTGLAAAIIMLQACGFQLRGAQSGAAVRMANLDLRSVSAAELAREVRSQLQRAGVAFTADAEYTLTIEHEAYERSVLSVSPRTGKAEEFQLTLTARMSLARADGTTLVNNELIAVSRDYLFDEDALLGKASEEDVLKSNLRRQAAASIIRRVYAAAQVP